VGSIPEKKVIAEGGSEQNWEKASKGRPSGGGEQFREMGGKHKRRVGQLCGRVHSRVSPEMEGKSGDPSDMWGERTGVEFKVDQEELGVRAGGQNREEAWSTSRGKKKSSLRSEEGGKGDA